MPTLERLIPALALIGAAAFAGCSGDDDDDDDWYPEEEAEQRTAYNPTLTGSGGKNYGAPIWTGGTTTSTFTVTGNGGTASTVIPTTTTTSTGGRRSTTSWGTGGAYDCPTAQPISGDSCSISDSYYCQFSGGAVRCRCMSSTWECENLSGDPRFGATGGGTGDGGGAGQGSEETGGDTGDSGGAGQGPEPTGGETGNGGGAGQGSEPTGGAPAQTGGASATGGVEDTGCSSSQPSNGESCDDLGVVCTYPGAECVCSSNGWLCGTTVPDCPPDTPGDGVSCGLVGQPCEYADGSCVCTSANQWLCL